MSLMISATDWEEKGFYLPVKDYTIFVIDTKETSKDTIVLIHGFPTSSWDWAKIWSLLSEKYHLIAMDMLGFGLSDKPDPHDYSILEQADIIEDVISQLGPTKFHVLAHDYGDTVAQELLARQNEISGLGLWTSLCLLNGGLFPETHKALWIQKLLLSPIGPLINKLSNRRSFDASMSRVFGPQTQPSQADLDEFWKLINHNNGRHIFHNLITYMRDRKTHRSRWIAALKDAQIPISLINGSFDPVSGAHMIAHYKDIVGDPDALAELANIGHYPQVEAPNIVTQAYLKFLETVDS